MRAAWPVERPALSFQQPCSHCKGCAQPMPAVVHASSTSWQLLHKREAGTADSGWSLVSPQQQTPLYSRKRTLNIDTVQPTAHLLPESCCSCKLMHRDTDEHLKQECDLVTTYSITSLFACASASREYVPIVHVMA